MSASSLPPLLSLAPQTLAEVLEGPGRADDVLALLRRGLDPFEPGHLAPGAHQRLRERTRPSLLHVDHVLKTTDGTQKLLCRLHDGLAIEAVLIPSEGRTTLCISSQVGCRRGCTFCLTGTMGLVRHLDADEILAQVMVAMRQETGLPPLRNIVFMGMGEPLDNPRAVTAAVSLLSGPKGWGFGAKHITVSTVGPSPAAVRSVAGIGARLAWSLHAADEELRRQLVPTTRHAPKELLAAFEEVLKPTRQALFVELTLLQETNDAPEAAEAALRLFEDFEPEVRFNLLPMNPIPGSPLGPSSKTRVDAFAEVLMNAGYLVKRREARGQDGRAACGQLAVLDSLPKLG